MNVARFRPDSGSADLCRPASAIQHDPESGPRSTVDKECSVVRTLAAVTQGHTICHCVGDGCFLRFQLHGFGLNDLLDIENDRRHPSKRNHPFAAGDLQISSGLLLSILLFAGGLALLPLLPSAFDLWLAVYITGTLAYSFYLKQIAVFDVLLLSSLYALRLLGRDRSHRDADLAVAGGVLDTPVSLAGDGEALQRARKSAGERFQDQPRARHTVSDMQQVRSFGTSSATAAVVMFMLYIGHPDVTRLYSHASHLWLIVPLLIYWLFRVSLLAGNWMMTRWCLHPGIA